LSGGQLARQFHADVVAPLLAQAIPGLGYAAGRLGSGSDVLGLDDAMSRDHDWGCRLTLLVDEADRDAVPQIGELLERELPSLTRGIRSGSRSPGIRRPGTRSRSRRWPGLPPVGLAWI
jgi:hypothetical protein